MVTIIEIFNETGKSVEYLDELLIYLNNISKDMGNDASFNVIIVDENKIRELNRDFRGKDYPTDVISFALNDYNNFVIKEKVLGDIYICLEKVIDQAKEYGHSFKRELFFLATHGFLHILGYDHMTKEEEEVMFGLQRKLLDKYGIKRETK